MGILGLLPPFAKKITFLLLGFYKFDFSWNCRFSWSLIHGELNKKSTRYELGVKKSGRSRFDDLFLLFLLIFWLKMSFSWNLLFCMWDFVWLICVFDVCELFFAQFLMCVVCVCVWSFEEVPSYSLAWELGGTPWDI